MNVRLQYDLDFLAGVYYDNQLQMNRYSVSMNLLTKTKDSASTNIALDRVKLFVASAMESTVFINQNNQEQAEFMQMIGINVTTLPEEPVDQIVGMMLYYKLNAIMEGRMEIVNLDISSALGDLVWYQHDEEDMAGPFAEHGWWHESNMKHDTVEPETVSDNVVKVTATGWHEMNLDWPENTFTATEAKILYAKFPRNEK
jgi:hypothetical protein